MSSMKLSLACSEMSLMNSRSPETISRGMVMMGSSRKRIARLEDLRAKPTSNK